MTRPSRRPDWIRRGPRLTKKERAAMLERQGGVCAVEGCGSTGPFEADHTWAVTDGNTGKPDRLICKSCHAPKSAGEKARADKADAQGGRTGQWSRRLARKAKGQRPLIQNAGFSKTMRKKFNGQVERRT